MKFLAAIVIVFGFSGCFTLENRRDLYTADFDRSPVHTSTTTTTTTTRVSPVAPVTTRKTAPEVKPIPSDPEEANLPPPLPTP